MKWFRLVFLASSFVLAGCSGKSQDLFLPAADSTIAKPDGLSWLSRASLNAFLDFTVWRGTRSGFITMFARDGHVVFANTHGYADIESKRPFELDTRVRIASMTKPVAGVAAMILIEEGKLGIDDEVSRYIPAAAKAMVATSESKNAAGDIPVEPLATPITVRHLLMFSSGVGHEDYKSDLGEVWNHYRINAAGLGKLEARIDRMFKAPLFEQPGTKWRYGWSADVLGRIVEVASGQDFDTFLRERLFEPLEMNATGFGGSISDTDDLATVYSQDENRKLVAIDPKTHTTEWFSGGGGLVSTIGDYMRFALMLWNDGSYNGVQILKPETVAMIRDVHVEKGVLAEYGFEGMGWGLGGSVVVDAEATPIPDRDGDYWWAGFYDTKFFISPSTGLVGIVMTQNQPGPYSGQPIATSMVQGFGFFGL